MLSRIMKEFRQSGGVISLNDLSRRLGIERSALDGMLETLARQGKIKETTGENSDCSTCSHSSNCPYVGKGPQAGKIFELNE